MINLTIYRIGITLLEKLAIAIMPITVSQRSLLSSTDVIPSSTNPPTHYTIYPTVSMPYDDFSKAFTGLPWSYAGKK